MEQLVNVIQRLHEALSALGDASIRLPAIVAVGGQSSGKSSVLEGIVGRDFLPRGTGIVTRRPVMMYLHTVPKLSPEALAQIEEQSDEPHIDRNEWCEFQHRPGFRYYNFEEVRTEIVREMERVAGRNKGISVEPICLTIHSPRVPDLVIIDLPGITKVPVGDQPADIELQVRRLCMHYMTQQSNIILAVHPANQDIANSDALKLAMEADPEGERTIGVLTKVDLMDPGTDARDVLSGRVIPLRRGFVPIVCRSQRDINEGMPIADGLSRERLFFERHHAYRPMAARCGLGYLSRVLSYLLFSAIRAHLPSIRSQLTLSAQSLEQQLRELGEPVAAASPREQGHLLLRLLSRFASNFCDMVEGRVHSDAGSDLLIDELFGGARIQEIVRTRFNQWTLEWEQLMDRQLKDEEILMALRNSAGPRSSLFIPEQAFASLVRRQIVQLRDLGRRFADEVYEELRRVAEKCEPPQLFRFGELREMAVEVVQALLRRSFAPTVQMIDQLIEVELAHINTTHPDFIGASRALEYVLLSDGAAPAALNHLEDLPALPEDEDEPLGVNSSIDSFQDVDWAIKRISNTATNANSGNHGNSNHNNNNKSGIEKNAPTKDYLGEPQVLAARERARQQTSQDDISRRFGARVVHEMLGGDEDIFLGGGLGAARRVGSANSPFVELPRPSPHARAVQSAPFEHALNSQHQNLGRDGQLLVALPPPSPSGSFSPLLQRHALLTPFQKQSIAAQIANANKTENLEVVGAGFQGSNLLVIPSKPLPEVITPADLKPDNRERREIRIIRVLLASYLAIVKKNYTDLVPKTVMCMLVNKVKDEIASELVHHLYSSITSVDALLRETDDVAEKRLELTDQLNVINRGISILSEIRDLGLSGPSTAPMRTSSSSISHLTNTESKEEMIRLKGGAANPNLLLTQKNLAPPNHSLHYGPTVNSASYTLASGVRSSSRRVSTGDSVMDSNSSVAGSNVSPGPASKISARSVHYEDELSNSSSAPAPRATLPSLVH